MLKLKLQHFGHLKWRLDALEKTLRLGGIGGRRRRGRQRMNGWMASPTQWTWVWVNSKSWWWTEGPGMLRFMGSQRVGQNWATELNWHNILSMLVLVFKTVNLISFCTVNVSIRLVKKVSSMVNVKTAPAIMLAFILTYFHRELALMNLLWEVLNQILCQDFTLMSNRWLDLFSVKIDIMVTSSSVK